MVGRDVATVAVDATSGPPTPPDPARADGGVADGDRLHFSEGIGFHPSYLATHGDDAPLHLLRMLVRSSADLIVVLDDHARLVYANPAAERVLGFSSANDVSPDIFELVHPDDQEHAARNYLRDLSEPGTHPPAVYRVRTATGEWRFLEIVATNCLEDPAINGVVLNARDITRAESLFHALRTFGQANQALVRATSEPELLDTTCRTIVEVGGYAGAWVAYVEHDADRRVRPVASCGAVGHLSEVRISWADDERGQGPAGLAVRHRRTQVVQDFRRSSAPQVSRDALEREGLRSVCVLPLERGDEVIGVLAIFAQPPHGFEDKEVELFEQLAASLAYGIGRLRDGVSLTTSEERFRSLATASPIGIVESGPNGDARYVNPRFCELTGVAGEDLVGTGWLASIHRDDRRELRGALRELAARGAGIETQVRLVRADDDLRHVRISAARKSHDDEVVLTFQDVTDEVRSERELRHLALHDPHTGLPNRAQFLEHLDAELARIDGTGDQLAVLFLDLDRLKVINDTLGHATGDLVISEVGRRVRATVRSSELVARFSGDEFMFLLRDVASEAEAVTAAERMLGLLAVPMEVGGHRLRVSGSMGVVVVRPGTRADEVLRDADTALFQAKSAGRNRYALFDEALHRRLASRLEMEQDLRMAVSRDQLEVHFQPIINLRTGRPVAAEALVRWNHPDRGVVPPLDFIPLAEESGIVREIGGWVFEHSLAQLDAWDHEPGRPQLDFISVNFSARQLDDSDGIAEIGRTVHRHHVAPSRVEIEVTESVAMSSGLGSAAEPILALRDEGLRVSIDDFGTGYSSLSYLHTLPVETLKIDRSFIERLDDPDGSGPVVRAILDMSHAMGLRVVAEGVSSPPLLDAVVAMGCDLAQGFLWTRPLPVGEFEQWWRDARGAVTPVEV